MMWMPLCAEYPPLCSILCRGTFHRVRYPTGHFPGVANKCYKLRSGLGKHLKYMIVSGCGATSGKCQVG